MSIFTDGMDVTAEIKSLRKDLDSLNNRINFFLTDVFRCSVRPILKDISSLQIKMEELKNENLELSRKFSLIIQWADVREYFRNNPDKLAEIKETIKNTMGKINESEA